MIEAGWPFVTVAYGVAGVGLFVLAAAILLRARHWAREARKLENP